MHHTRSSIPVPWLALAAAAMLALLALGCGGAATPTAPAQQEALGEPAASSADAGGVVESAAKVDVCHRTEGRRAFILISVSSNAVAAHLAHGDGRVGAAVPGQPGMRFDSACAPVSSPQVSTSSGFRGNAVWTIGPPFTVRATGPVHASAVVTTQYTLTEPLRIVLLGYDPQAPGPNHCVPTAIPEGPPMSAPTITADWASVPPGTYCLDVQDAIPPESQPPYSWTATITHP